MLIMSSNAPKPISIRTRDEQLNPVIIKSPLRKNSQRGSSSPLLVVYGFFGLIIIGAIMLRIPLSSNFEQVSFIDAIFTATSAVTVTGLTVVETSSTWSFFGQIVIAFLIVIGGIGFMTGAAFFLIAAGQSLGFQRSIQIGQGLGEENLSSVTKVVSRVVVSSIFFQIIGALIFFIAFSYKFGIDDIQQNTWYAIFHSISSFNNAGFTVFHMGGNLEAFSRGALNNTILLITSLMFFFGGIGYFVMTDIVHHRKIIGKRGFKSYRVLLSLETKLILAGSLILSILGMFFIFIFEFSNPNTIGDFTLIEKIINSLFTSMSTRTAGFNSFAMNETYDYTNLVCILLIFIGGAPASTAGGIKITTFIISVFMIINHMKGRENISIFKREIPYDIGVRALVILLLSLFVIGIMMVTISFIEYSHVGKDHYFVHLIFEIISAFGTNGMSTGITEEISNISKVIFSTLMFIGRLGPMTLALLLAGSYKPVEYRFFQEKVRIG